MGIQAVTSAAMAPGEWIKYLPRAPWISSAGRGWKVLQVCRLQNPADCRVELPPLDAHLVGLHVSGPCEMISHWEGLTRRRHWFPGEAMIMSANKGSAWEWHGAPDEIQMYVQPQALADAAAEVSDRPVQLLDGLGIIDPVISEIALRVSTELAGTNASPLFDECIASALIARLLSKYSTLRAKESVNRLDISSHRLRAALEYIDTHLEDNLTLDSIAAAAGMSTFHFARGFRKAVGRPPHNYLLVRRMDRARMLLSSSSAEIIVIAHKVGFASQSHFSAVFRRQFGMTPCQYRQSVRGV